MKIGIVTFHRAENFGAALQAYALQRYLESLKHEVRIIDYRCPNIESMYHIWNPAIILSRKNVFLSIKTYFSRFNHIKDRFARKTKFHAFRCKYLYLCSTSDINTFDVLITGSDQVWNLHLTGGFDKTYFLSSIGKHGVKKISYAASSDRDPNDLLQKNHDAIADALNSFSAISVREEQLKTSLNRFTDKNISVCCDPTFLIDQKGYDNLETKPQEKDYILVYHMTESEVASRAADLLAERKHCQIIEIHGSYPRGIKNNNRHRINLGPSEILGYIRGARIVITTSFHGLSLSVIHKKTFWIFDKGDNYRQKNLLAKLGLSDRLISKPEDCLQCQSIDYTRLEPDIEDLIKSSQLFLQESLKF